MAMKLTLFVLLLVVVTSVLGDTAERPLRRRRPTVSEALTSSSPNHRSKFSSKLVQDLLLKPRFNYDVKDFMESCKLEPGCLWNCEKAENSKQTECYCLCKTDELNVKTHHIIPPRFISH